MITLFAIMGMVGMIAAILFAIYRQGKKSERLAQNEDTIEKISRAKKLASTVRRNSGSAAISELFTRWKRK